MNSLGHQKSSHEAKEQLHWPAEGRSLSARSQIAQSHGGAPWKITIDDISDFEGNVAFRFSCSQSARGGQRSLSFELRLNEGSWRVRHVEQVKIVDQSFDQFTGTPIDDDRKAQVGRFRERPDHHVVKSIIESAFQDKEC